MILIASTLAVSDTPDFASNIEQGSAPKLTLELRRMGQSGEERLFKARVVESL